MRPNPARPRTRPSRSGCTRRVQWAGSLSLGREAENTNTWRRYGPNEDHQWAAFTAADLGPFSQLDQYQYKHPALPRETDGKLFLNKLLGLTSSEISLNKLPPRTSMPFYHTHRLNEEIYTFLKGEGEFQIDGAEVLSCKQLASKAPPMTSKPLSESSRSLLKFAPCPKSLGPIPT